MSKRAERFARIAEFKARFGKLPSARLREHVTNGFLIKEAGIAIRELLDERERASATTSFVAEVDEGVDDENLNPETEV